MADKVQEPDIFTIVSGDGDTGPEGEGRHVFICIGLFGKRVLDHMTTCMDRLEQRWPFLTQFVDLGPDALPDWELPDNATRREMRQAFIRKNNIEHTFNTFSHAVTGCARMPEIGDTPGRIDPTLKIHIVADLSDLFSSAVLLDTANLVGLAARRHPYFVSGVFSAAVFPEGNKNDARDEAPGEYSRFSFREAIVYAALQEVDVCRRYGLGPEFDYQELFPHNRERNPFGQCHVLLNRNREGEIPDTSVEARLIARYLLRFSRSGFGEDLFEQSPGQPLYGSMGISSFFLPRAQIYLYCLHKWAENVFSEFQKTEKPATHEENDLLTAVGSDRIEQILDSALPPRLQLWVSESVSGARKDLAEAFLTLDASLDEYILEIGTAMDLDRVLGEDVVDPARDRLTKLTDRIVADSLSGAASMAALLRRGLGELAEMATGIERECEKKKKKAINSKQSLKKLLDIQKKSTEKVPAGWTLVIRPFRLPAAIRLRRELNDLREEWLKQMETSRDLLVDAFLLEAKARALRMVSEIMKQELDVIEGFLNHLEQVSNYIRAKYQEVVPTSCIVDLSALQESDYDLLYQHYFRLAINDVSSRSLSDLAPWKELVNRFRKSSVENLSAPIEEKGHRMFSGIAELRLHDIGGIRALNLKADWMEEFKDRAWDYANPLIGETMPQNLAEVCALKVPEDPLGAAMAPDGTLYGVPAKVFVGGDISVRFCRAVYGFPFSEMRFLSQYGPSYGRHKDDPGLHIIDWKNKFHPIPE